MTITRTHRPGPTEVRRIRAQAYRLTLVVDINCRKDGKLEKCAKALATLESDGEDWRAVDNLLF